MVFRIHLQDHVRRQTCFTSKKPAKEIICKMAEAAEELGFSATTRHYKVVFLSNWITVITTFLRICIEGVLWINICLSAWRLSASWKTLGGIFSTVKRIIFSSLPLETSRTLGRKCTPYCTEICFSVLCRVHLQMRLEGISSGRTGQTAVAIEVRQTLWFHSGEIKLLYNCAGTICRIEITCRFSMKRLVYSRKSEDVSLLFPDADFFNFR